MATILDGIMSNEKGSAMAVILILLCQLPSTLCAIFITDINHVFTILLVVFLRQLLLHEQYQFKTK